MNLELVRRLELELLAAVLRRTDWQKGRWRLQRRAMSLVRTHLPASRTLVVRSRPGFRIRIDGTSQVGRVVFATGEYEPEVTRLIQALAPRGGVVLDIGAHIGYFTV